MTKNFSFNPKLDVTFIPFMPATIEDDVELRLQIRRNNPNALLDCIISLDEEALVEVQSYDFDKFAFFKHTQKYSAGSHTVTVRYKSSDEPFYTIEKLTFTIEEKRHPLLQGGFIRFADFYSGTEAMTDDEWGKYINALNEIHQKCIIIMVTIDSTANGDDKVAHYGSKLYPPSFISAYDPIRKILETAEANHQYVFLGLGTPSSRLQLANTLAVMDELYSLYGDSPAFYGWYESEEFNLRCYHPSLGEQWSELRKRINSLSPVKPLLISPCIDNVKKYNTVAGIDPSFIEILKSGLVDFDIIAPQDMVGHTIEGGRMTVKETAEMFSFLSQLCKQGNQHLWANCESFDIDEDDNLLPRFNGGGMDGENGFIQQLQSAHPHVEKIITYRFNELFTPPNFTPRLGGDKAVEQYEIYCKYQNNILNMN